MLSNQFRGIYDYSIRNYLTTNTLTVIPICPYCYTRINQFGACVMCNLYYLNKMKYIGGIE